MTPPIPRLGPLVDTHAHLADDRLRQDLRGVLDRARAAGLVQIIAIGTDAADSVKLHSGESRSRRRPTTSRTPCGIVTTTSRTSVSGARRPSDASRLTISGSGTVATQASL